MTVATHAGDMNEKLIVVAGAAGKLGRLVVESLLAEPEVRVRALVRDPKRPELAGLAGGRVELLAFDAVKADAATLAEVVRGSFAVVSTLQGGPDVIVDAQLRLLRAAKAAGARRFIPSDFSFDVFELPEDVNVNSDWRRALALAARGEVTDTFEVVHVFQGMFADAGVVGFVGLLDAEAATVRYWGDGRTPMDWTTWEDTARFTARAATDERAVPERLWVSGDRMDALTFARVWGEVKRRPVKTERLGSLEELAALTQRKLAEEPSNMMAWLPLMYARGLHGGLGLLGPSHNARYPEIQPESVHAAIERGAL
jgi:nucleoside-diphosphate-sugar epimerase